MTGGIDASLANRLMAHESDMVKQGGQLLQQGPPPCDDSRRGCRDKVWALFFLLVLLGVFALAGMAAMELADGPKGKHASSKHRASSKHQASKDATAAFDNMAILAMLAAAATSAVSALLFLQLTSICAPAMVWISLFLTPVLLIGLGVGLFLMGMWPGIILAVVGLLLGMCTFFCYRSLVPFTVLVLETVVHVIKMHSAMMLISIFGSILSLVWVLACVLAAYGQIGNSRGDDLSNAPIQFVATLVLIWGSLVCTNICHVACSGVFGRWYFGKDREGSPVKKSLTVACTTSFGSVCFGSFVVAFVRTIEATAKAVQRCAMEDRNMVLCVIAACVQCIVGCIGDMLEWFNSYAYVQCAVRGFDLIDAARATYALCVCGNIANIIAVCMVGWVAGLGTLFCGALGVLVTLPFRSPVGSVLGFFMAFVVGGGALQVIDSGATALMVCWAENPGALSRMRPHLHSAFEQRSLDSTGSREVELRQ